MKDYRVLELEYVEGISLGQMIRASRWQPGKEEILLEILFQIGIALNFCRKNGIIHAISSLTIL
jgi:serine/threonine protein kinase